MPRAEINPDKPQEIMIETGYQDRYLIKQLPGANWDGDRKVWKAPTSWASAVILRGLFGPELELGDEFKAWGWRERRDRVDEANRLREKLALDDDDESPAAKVIRSWRDDPELLALGSTLRPFQEAGIRYLHAAIMAGLTDPMGSGKTMQGIMTIRLVHELGEQALPALIVAPNTVKTSWAKEFPKWWPSARVQLVHGGAGARREQLKAPADVYIINWEALRLHSRLAGYGSYALRSCHVCDPAKAELLKNAKHKVAEAGHNVAEAEAECKLAEAEMAVDTPDVVADVVVNKITLAEAKNHLEAFETVLAEAKKHLQTTERDVSHGSCEKCPRELNEIDWRLVIADEAHRAKDPKSKQTRALWAVSRPATRRIFMTGTPIANRPDELWSPLHFMDPREWPSKSKYVDYFTNKVFNFWGGMEILGLNAETRPQFFAIVNPRMRRMPKEVILPQLPPKVPVERIVPMTPKQAKAYKQMVDEKLAELGDGDVSQLLVGANPLTRNTRLMQLASAMLTPEGDGYVMVEPSSKLDDLDELIEDAEGEQLVVFAMSKQLINLAAARAEKRKISFGLITGDQSVPERQQTVDEFQAGDLRMVFATTAAGGTGITLTAARTLIRLQRDWSAVNNSQAEDRIHRIGSEIHESVSIVDMVAPGTVEIHQLEALAGKHGNLQEIVRDKEALRRLLYGEQV